MEFPCPLSHVCVCAQPVLSQQGRFQLGGSGGSLVSSDTCFRPVCCEERHTSTPSTSWTRTTAVRPRYGTTKTHCDRTLVTLVCIEYSTFAVWIHNTVIDFSPVLTVICSQCMLEKVGSWNFNIFLFNRLTNGKYFNSDEPSYFCVWMWDLLYFTFTISSHIVYVHFTFSCGQLCHLLVESWLCNIEDEALTCQIHRSSYILCCFEGNSLVFLTFHLLNQYGLIELFQLDMVKVRRFLGKCFSCLWLKLTMNFSFINIILKHSFILLNTFD